MTQQELTDRVRQIVSTHLHADYDKVVRGAKFDDLGADSLDYVELLLEFEESFDIVIPDDEAMDVDTVGAAIDYLAKKLAVPA